MIFLPNIEELKNITGQTSLEKAISAIQHIAQQVVVKNGNSGAMLWSHNELFEQPSFLNKEVVDAIGAGDSFNAGYIHQFVHGKAPADCLEFGALCGAINTTASGGTTAFADHETVKRIALSKFNFPL